mmetsp:Transcript_56628/g.100057  ORF Transcript_56628/g.100057 Transcript_56628/m.100057 type:complete len:108 (-) Transcript_56628:234-557(-)
MIGEDVYRKQDKPLTEDIPAVYILFWSPALHLSIVVPSACEFCIEERAAYVHIMRTYSFQVQCCKLKIMIDDFIIKPLPVAQCQQISPPQRDGTNIGQHLRKFCFRS